MVPFQFELGQFFQLRLQFLIPLLVVAHKKVCQLSDTYFQHRLLMFSVLYSEGVIHSVPRTSQIPSVSHVSDLERRRFSEQSIRLEYTRKAVMERSLEILPRIKGNSTRLTS